MTQKTQAGASHFPRARPGSGRVTISVPVGAAVAVGAAALPAGRADGSTRWLGTGRSGGALEGCCMPLEPSTRQRAPSQRAFDTTREVVRGGSVSNARPTPTDSVAPRASVPPPGAPSDAELLGRA